MGCSSANPLGLSLGERIKYTRQCHLEYNEHNFKELVFDEPCERYTTVIGSVKKAIGKYIPGRHYLDLDGGDYDPPRMEPFKYYRLYECRDTLTDKPFFVLPEDILTSLDKSVYCK